MANTKGAAMKVNKTQEIKKYLQANPTAGPKKFATALKERGIDVSQSFAGVVKYKGGAERGRRRRSMGSRGWRLQLRGREA
jgi:hypothetical protein